MEEWVFGNKWLNLTYLWVGLLVISSTMSRCDKVTSGDVVIVHTGAYNEK